MAADTSATRTYDYVKIDTTPDGKAAPGVAVPGGTDIRGCAKKANRVVKLHHHDRIVRAVVYVNGKRVKVARGHRLREVTIPEAGGGKQRVKIVLVSARGRHYTSIRTYKGCKKTKPHRVKRHRR